MKDEKREKVLYIRVKYNGKEAEISYPLSERTQVTYDGSTTSTLVGAVKAVKDLVETLKD
jgi:hypothetical protein